MRYFTKLSVFCSFIGLSCMISCSNDEPKANVKPISNETGQVVSGGSNEEIIASTSTKQKVYELKEDGLYVYSDASPKLDYNDLGCVTYTQKNYCYLKVPSATSQLKNEEGQKSYQYCDVAYTCEDNFGKPTLKELGYERHEEREIKPEDNRFGVTKKVQKTIIKKEKKLQSETFYTTVPKSAFIDLSRSEFIENGIVVIGKHVSRVVIKSLVNLPKFNDRVAVNMTVKNYDCEGTEVGKRVITPKEIADFKKIDFKENIFEFVQDEPIPGNAAYLSDEEFMKLTNDIHQLIPRIYDRTIHNVATYSPDYYIIEYYNGDQLYDYQCIRITGAACAPKLWDKLEAKAPTSSADIPNTNDKCYLILKEFNSASEANSFVKKKPVGDALLYHLRSGKVVLGIECETKNTAESEMKRYLNMGFKKESIRIEKL